jgi:biopolymer transport protein ExbB/TolQ
MEQEKWENLLAFAEKHPRSHVAAVFSNALREFRKAREVISTKDAVKVANRGAHVAANQMHEQLQQGVSGLKAIAITAPFVGLFGTAVKLLDWFGPVEGQRYSNVLGIFRITAESLASTAAGLLVGILAVGWFNWRSDHLEVLDAEMQVASLDVAKYLEPSYPVTRPNGTQRQKA